MKVEIGGKYRHNLDKYIVEIKNIDGSTGINLVYFKIGNNNTYCDESYFIKYFSAVENKQKINKQEIYELIKKLEL